MKIALTFDVDWAPEFVLEFVMDLIQSYDISATFFVTHYSELINSLDRKKYEVALHPNFNYLLGESNLKKEIHIVFQELLNLYPESIGFRSHCLFQSSQIISEASKLGLKYDSNLLLLNQKCAFPFYHSSLSIFRIPYFFSDDTYLTLSDKNFEIDGLFSEINPFHVIAFHPIHIFLNTEDIQRYNTSRLYLQNRDKLKNYVNTGGTGIQTMFKKALGYIKENNIQTTLLRNVYTECLNNKFTAQYDF